MRVVAVRIAMLLLLALLVTACGGEAPAETKTDAADAADAEDGAAADSTLVLKGRPVDAQGRFTNEPAETPSAKVAAAQALKTRKAAKRTVREIKPPPLNADGTITLADDPFAGTTTRAQTLPIEDDAATTAGIERLSASMRRVDIAQWNRWMTAGPGNIFGQTQGALTRHVVRIYVERCGGAQTVATGVVLGNETVVTAAHVVESPETRVLVAAAGGARLGAMVRYLDVDDDIAVLKVPGLDLAPLPIHAPAGAAPTWAYAFGVASTSSNGSIQQTPVMVTMEEGTIDREQPDGFAERISDRSVQTLVGAVDTGYSGGPVMATNDANLVTGWGFHGLVRARVPFRSNTGGIVVPSRLVTAALTASARLEQWYEHVPGGCPQWHRSR
ncbi:MAG: Colicin production protein [Thermoleophilia bacterium]|nr:Colicin production protein [Thermoleophilia bacterium]